MAYRLIVYPRVDRVLHSIYDWGVQDSGIRAARTFVRKIVASLSDIRKHPCSYSVEPALEGMNLEYRSMVAHPYFKFIFYIDEFSKTIYVVDLWDTRMDPLDLVHYFEKYRDK